MAQRFNSKNIRTLLTQGFSDEELRLLCYDTPDFRSVYDRLGQGMGKTRVVQELIEYAERRGLLETLLAMAKELNPVKFEEHQPYYYGVSSHTSGDVPGKSQTATPVQPPPLVNNPQSGDVNISDISGRDVEIGPITSGNVGGDVVGSDKVGRDKVGRDQITINIGSPDTEASKGSNAEESQSSSGGVKKWWVPIAVAIIGLIGAIFTAVWNAGGDSQSTPAPTASDFTYQVRVQAKDTNDNIPNATVIIEVGGKAPVDGITDSTGLARILVSSSYSGQPGRLIVEADGYLRHRQEIDITEGALPKDILLEPEP